MQTSVLERQGKEVTVGIAFIPSRSGRTSHFPTKTGEMYGNGIKLSRSGSAGTVLTIAKNKDLLELRPATSRPSKFGVKIVIPSTQRGGPHSAKNLSTGPRTPL